MTQIQKMLREEKKSTKMIKNSEEPLTAILANMICQITSEWALHCVDVRIEPCG
jgi:hypothetical protein